MAGKKKVKQIEQVKGIEIANPLYDVVFKYLMENNRVASYFVETIIGEKVENITMLTTESTVFKWASKFEKLKLTPNENGELTQITAIRLDFVATVKTDDGNYKKILIEIQKARDTTDIMRFRYYLAEQYKRKETITVNGKTTSEPLPIITIYLLGFNLQETDAIVISAKRDICDAIENKKLNVKIPFLELLTHDSYIVQLGRITGKMQTRTEKLLSVFEQRYFIDSETKTTKMYPYVATDDVVGLMLEILEHVGADPEKRAEIELEWASQQILRSLILNREKALNEAYKNISKKEKDIAKKDKIISESQKTIKNLSRDNEENQKTIAQLFKEIEDLKKSLK